MKAATTAAGPAPTPRGGSLRLFRHRDFALFFTAASISNGGSWMQAVAVPALLFDLTGKAAWLGYASIAATLPAVVITPYAGVLADRVSRRLILIVTQILQMSAAGALWLAYHQGHATAELIVGLGFVSGVGAGFQMSAWQTFVPTLVPLDEMVDAIKLNSLQFTMARALGPAFAGVVVKAWGVEAAIAVNAVTYALVIAALLISRPRVTATAPATTGAWEHLRDGARYVWGKRPIRLAALIALLTAALGQSIHQMAPAISHRVLDRPSTDNAGLLVAVGCGSITAAGFGMLRSSFARARTSTSVITVLTLYTASALVVSLTSNYTVGLFGFFLGGFAHFQASLTLNTFMQTKAPDHLRGRAISFYLLGIFGGIPIGAYAIGRLGDWLGMRAALRYDAAGMAIVLVAVVASGWIKDFDVSEVIGEA